MSFGNPPGGPWPQQPPYPPSPYQQPPPGQPWPVMPLAYQPHDAQARRDGEHLKLLSLFHYIYGGLTMAISCIFIVHIVIGGRSGKTRPCCRGTIQSPVASISRAPVAQRVSSPTSD